MNKKVLAIWAMCLFTMLVYGQERITVRVINQQHEPVVGATVTIDKTSNQTNKNGIVYLSVNKNENHEIKVRHVGYIEKDEIIKKGISSLTVILQELSIQADEVFVYATRANKNSATTYKNLSKENIQKNNLGQDIPYLLDQTPGVVVGSDAGGGVGYTNMTIRGSNGQRINVTLNGIPLNDAESMGSFFVNLPDFASSTESIQIQRGIGTSTNGAGAFGGSINIQSDALENNAYAELNNTFGSFNTWKNTVKVGSGLLDNKYAFNARLSRISSDGYIDRATSDLKSFYVDAGYYGKKHQIKATIFSGKEKTYQAWDGVPEDKLESDRTYNVFTYPNQTDNYTQTHHHLHYNYFASEKTSYNIALHYTRGAGYYEEYKNNESFSKYGFTPIIIKDSTINKTDLVRRRWLDNHFYGLVFSTIHQFNPNQTLTIGGAANQYKGDHYGEVIWAQYASNSQLGDKYYFNDAKKDDANIFTKWNSIFGSFNLYADLQYRFVNYTFEGYDHNMNVNDVNVKHHFFNPKAGLTYRLNSQSSLYSSYAFANKEPVRNDYIESVANERPKPEKMHNIELGYRLGKEKINLSANVYGMFYKDQLILTGEINDVGAVLRENVPNSYRVGLEVDANWRISNQLTWNTTAALSRNKIKNYKEYLTVLDEYWGDTGVPQVVKDYKSTTISYSPSTILSSDFTYAIITPFRVSLTSKYVSRQYLDNTEAKERSINPFFVNNLRFLYSFSAFGIKHIDANLAINNIFNEKYETNGYTYGGIDALTGVRLYGNGYYPQATTNFLFGLNLRF